MMEIHTKVSYGGNGICEITDICTKTIDGTTKQFYVLTPLHGDSAIIYVPAESEELMSRMYQLMTAEEAKCLIRQMPSAETGWIEDEKMRCAYEKSVLSSGDRMALVSMTKSLYEQKQMLAAKGKRLRTADAQALKQGENKLFGELSVVLRIERDQVLKCIQDMLAE